MAWWKDWGRYAAAGASVIAGGALAFLNPAAGLIVAGAGLSATGLVDNFVTGNENADRQQALLDDQKMENNIQFAAGDLDSVIGNISQIDSYLTEVQKSELQISDNEYNIGVNREWLSMYQGMLSGEDNLLSQERDILSQTVDLQKQSAELYRQSSDYERQKFIDQGYDTYAQMMHQKSLANVIAGAYGGGNAYTTKALSIQNDIRRFVGDDMTFNTDGTTDAPGGGTFLKELGILTSSIDLKRKENDILIASAQLKLDQTLDSWQTKSEGLIHENTDMEKSNEIMKGNVELYLSTVDLLQENAMSALKDYRDRAKAAGKTDEEIGEVDKRYRDALSARGWDK